METAAVPQQVQDQMAAATQLQAQLYAEPPAAPAVPAAPEVPPPAEPTAAEAPPAEPAVPTVAEPVAPQPAPDMEQAYKTLRGKYDAEVPRLHQQLRDMSAQMRTMQARLEQAEKRPEPEAKPQESVTEKDIEFYGAEMVDFIKRVCGDVVATASVDVTKKLAERIDALFAQVGNVQQHVAQSAEDVFWGKVKALVPDWATVDSTPEWIAFLQTTPDFTTDTYEELARKAMAVGDAQKIANLVGIWRKAMGFTATPVVTPTVPTPPQAPNPELQRQVAPSTARAATPPPAQRTWTGAQYEAIFSPHAEKQYSAKELATLQADAQQALAEGRIRW